MISRHIFAVGLLFDKEIEHQRIIGP